MSRGWQWIDEDSPELTEERIDEVSPLLDALARQWSALHDAEERRGFIRQSDRENGYDAGPDYDSDEEMRAGELMRREMESLRDAQHDAQLNAITDAMAKYGARMMRPYEHWNEDERYMQYMECDRFGE